MRIKKEKLKSIILEEIQKNLEEDVSRKYETVRYWLEKTKPHPVSDIDLHQDWKRAFDALSDLKPLPRKKTTPPEMVKKGDVFKGPAGTVRIDERGGDKNE